jgi:ankyrin repeat protein
LVRDRPFSWSELDLSASATFSSVWLELGKDLIEASRAGDSVKVSTLLSSQGVEFFINYQNEDGFTTLHSTTINEQEVVTKLLIQARCNVNVTSCFGRTPLLNVAQKGITVIVMKLIEPRCIVDLQANDGATAALHGSFFWASGGH